MTAVKRIVSPAVEATHFQVSRSLRTGPEQAMPKVELSRELISGYVTPGIDCRGPAAGAGAGVSGVAGDTTVGATSVAGD